MNMTKRRTIVLAGLSPLFAPAVKAQGAWPNKPLRFVIVQER